MGEQNWICLVYVFFVHHDEARKVRKSQLLGSTTRRLEWHPSYIARILHSREYIGEATFDAGDGVIITIKIPQIIPVEQWERVQILLEKRKKGSIRNASDIYLIQGLTYCGECGAKVSVAKERYVYGTMKDGSIKRYDRKKTCFRYRCSRATPTFKRGDHPYPFIFSGPKLDWAIWRTVVDQGIKNPEYIQEQILRRQAELQNQGETLNGQIGRIRFRLNEITEERAAYQRMLARNRITEDEFDSRMEETKEAAEFLQSELVVFSPRVSVIILLERPGERHAKTHQVAYLNSRRSH